MEETEGKWLDHCQLTAVKTERSEDTPQLWELDRRGHFVLIIRQSASIGRAGHLEAGRETLDGRHVRFSDDGHIALIGHIGHVPALAHVALLLSLCLVPVDMMFLTSAFTATALEDQVLLNGEVQQQGGG